jgi:hypothetical protein
MAFTRVVGLVLATFYMHLSPAATEDEFRLSDGLLATPRSRKVSSQSAERRKVLKRSSCSARHFSETFTSSLIQGWMQHWNLAVPVPSRGSSR